MARNFLGIPQQNFIGTVAPQAAQTFNAKFGNQPPLPPVTVECIFNWIVYGAGVAPNINVLVNLRNASTTQSIDQILSCRIDNLGNPVPVYVYFPDTNYTIVAPPNTVVWEPVQTGQFTAFIIGEGFTVGTVGSTSVYFCNFRVNPFIDYEFPQSAQLLLGSSVITRGSSIFNQNYATPAVQDQFFTVLSNTQDGPFTVFNFGTGFVYLNEISMVVSASSSGMSQFYTVVFESTGAAGIFWKGQFLLAASTVLLPVQILYTKGNYKLDGTQLWRLRNVLGLSGSAQLTANFGFTTNPN
jgi:hypothetical protein